MTSQRRRASVEETSLVDRDVTHVVRAGDPAGQDLLLGTAYCLAIWGSGVVLAKNRAYSLAFTEAHAVTSDCSSTARTSLVHWSSSLASITAVRSSRARAGVGASARARTVGSRRRQRSRRARRSPRPSPTHAARSRRGPAPAPARASRTRSAGAQSTSR